MALGTTTTRCFSNACGGGAGEGVAMRGAAAYAAGSGLRHSGDGGGGREMKWAHCSRQAAACLRPQPAR